MSTKATYLHSEELGFHLYHECLQNGFVWLDLKKEHKVIIGFGKTLLETTEQVSIRIPKEVWNEIIKVGPMKIQDGCWNFDRRKDSDVEVGLIPEQEGELE